MNEQEGSAHCAAADAETRAPAPAMRLDTITTTAPAAAKHAPTDLPAHLRDLQVVNGSSQSTCSTSDISQATPVASSAPVAPANSSASKLPLLPDSVKMEPSVSMGRPQPKRVIVCGAGIIGLTTSYYLAKQGHEVLCVERESTVGTQVSLCNGAFLDPALYSSWADFSLLRRAKAARGSARQQPGYSSIEQSGSAASSASAASRSEKSTVEVTSGPAASFAGEAPTQPLHTASRTTGTRSRTWCCSDRPMKIEFSALRDFSFWKWGFKFLMNSGKARANENGRTIRELGFYSMLKLRELQMRYKAEDLEMDQTARGTIEVFRHTGEYDLVMQSDRKRHLDELGMDLQPLNHVEAENLEASILPEVYEPGAILSSYGTNGDCHKMCLAMYKLCMRGGVMFRFNTEIHDVLTDRNRVVALQTRRGSLIEGDEFVLALGNSTRKVAKRAGINLSMYPVKGYIITVPVNEGFKAPVHNIYAGGQALISPLGDNLRISGGVDFGKPRASHSNQRRIDWLLSQGQSLFPEGYFNVEEMTTHVCWRPVTSDDVPLIGRTRLENLYVNAGHGSKGWTMSFGAAALLADEISGIRPQLEIARFDPHRFGIFG